MMPQVHSPSFPELKSRGVVDSPMRGVPESTATADQICIRRDAAVGDWIVDFTPGIDLLEIAQVLTAVQQQALDLLAAQVGKLAGHTSSPGR